MSRPVVISFIPIKDHFVITSGVFIEIIIALSLNGFISAHIVLFVPSGWEQGGEDHSFSPPSLTCRVGGDSTLHHVERTVLRVMQNLCI